MRYRLRTLLISAVILAPVLAWIIAIAFYFAEEARFQKVWREKLSHAQLDSN